MPAAWPDRGAGSVGETRRGPYPRLRCDEPPRVQFVGDTFVTQALRVPAHSCTHDPNPRRNTTQPTRLRTTEDVNDSSVKKSWALAGSNRRPLPCEGKKAGRHHWPFGRNPLWYRDFSAHCISLFRAVFHPLAYFLPTFRLKASGSWTIHHLWSVPRRTAQRRRVPPRIRTRPSTDRPGRRNRAPHRRCRCPHRPRHVKSRPGARNACQALRGTSTPHRTIIQPDHRDARQSRLRRGTRDHRHADNTRVQRQKSREHPGLSNRSRNPPPVLLPKTPHTAITDALNSVRNGYAMPAMTMVEVINRRDLMNRMRTRHFLNLQRARFHQLAICVGGRGTHPVDSVPFDLSPGIVLPIRPRQVQKL